MSLFPLGMPYKQETAIPSGISVQWRHRADRGITGSTPVTEWLDIGDEDGFGGNGDANLANTAGGPTFLSGGGPNGHDAVDFDGSDDVLGVDGITAVSLPWHVFLVARVNTFTSGEPFWGIKGSSHNGLIKSHGTTPAIVNSTSIANNANSNTDMSIGTWHLVQVLFINSSSAGITIDNGTPVTGTASGAAQDAVRLVLGGDDNMYALPCDVTIAEHIMCDAEVTGADLTQLLAYFNDRYALW